jgi:hypothetical protein
MAGALANFEEILGNIFLCKRSPKGDRLLCECSSSDPEPCGLDCLNRQLFYECTANCPCGSHCTNRQFTKRLYAKLEVFQTGKKGRGLRSLEYLPA